MNRQFQDPDIGIISLDEIDEISGYAAWSGEVKSVNDLIIKLAYTIPPHHDIEPYVRRSKPFVLAIIKEEYSYRIKAATAVQKQYNLLGSYTGENEFSVEEIAEVLYAPTLYTSEVEFISSIDPLTFIIPELIFRQEEYYYDLLTKEVVDLDATSAEIDSVIKYDTDTDEFFMPYLVYTTESTEKIVVVVIDPKMNFVGAYLE